MLGTIVRPSGAFLGTIPEGFRSEGKMPCAAVRMPGRSTIKAAVAEAEAEAFTPPSAMETGRKPMNLYEVLRVKKSASQSEIKSAYRSLAKIYHPDVAVVAKHPEESFGGCDFIEIHKAYSTLSDPAARAIYDLTLSIGSERRRPLAGVYNNNSSSGGFRRHSGFYTSRRWETDQCW
ncbi:OLC1v1022385C1 [Oldenlandia corymbosa var. corymbosa]|uniref:OLC1v1022385C1 n=1 Tax=Oldenlandia corymbosa var. corymbosa TaxID=529605 RepID=A0AAV1BXR1_OLDCO|nr:OLC1v1022385C1 [Oldenlandia corymbosa var. corymbosa]